MATKSQMSRAQRRAQRVDAARQRDARARRWRGWWIVAAAVLVAAAGAAWWVASARTQTPSGPVIGQPVPNEGFDHVLVGTVIQYRVHPPASGPHYPAPAPAGVYPEGLAPGFWVHNLEHGYIVLVYKPPVSKETLTEFDNMIKTFPKSKFGNVKLVIAPYAEMAHPFAALAWDWRMWLDTFDRARVLAFYRARVDHGREDLP